jgi:cell division septal protein FtsQ
VEGITDMTEKKQFPKQDAVRKQQVAQNYRVGLSVYRPDRREVSAASDTKKRAPQVVPRTLQRVVSVPNDNPAEAWYAFAQRQDDRRRARAHTARPRPQSVPRTLAQTGVRATAGRIGVVRRPLPYQASPIPLRSSRRQPRRNVFMRLLAFFILFALFVGSLSFFFAGGILRVQQVEVTGTSDRTVVQSIQQMNIRGQDMLFFDSAALQRRILAMPAVATVSIRKQMPDEVTISLVERQPVLLWQTSTGTFSIDRTGKVIAAVSRSSDIKHLATIIDITNRGQQANGSSSVPQRLRVGVSLASANVSFALNVLQSVPRVNHIDDFTLYYDGTMYAGENGQSFSSTAIDQGAYILQSAQGWKAYLGGAFDANSLQNRLLELQAILTQAQQQRLALSTIDLRYGVHPAVTLR